jgi:murein DD-endopeptidase MepM/ murein hydrolase activator NlpD
MAVQDRLDPAFTNKLLKKTLLSNKAPADDIVVANDNMIVLTKSNLVTISNSFTSLQNAFNKIYAHTLNVRNLHQYDEKRLSNIKRESNIENKITPGSSPVLNTSSGSHVSSASILDKLASSVEKLNDKMKNINLSGNMPLGNNIGSMPGMRGGSALGVLGGLAAPVMAPIGSLIGRAVTRVRAPQSEKYLTAAADTSSRAAAKVIKGQPPGPTSYSSKFSNYLSGLFISMPSWIDGIKGWLGFGENMPGGNVSGGNITLGSGQYAPVGDLGKAKGDWKKDTEFLTAVNNLAQKYNIDANDILGLISHESARTFNPTVQGKNGATGLFQFMPEFFDTKAIARMSRAEQVAYADKVIFARNKLPKGANAGQIYAAVFLPGIARRQGWSGVVSKKGDRYYDSNPSLDSNKDGMIDYSDLASVINGHRVRMGLGPSPSVTGSMSNAISTRGFIAPAAGKIGSGYRTAHRPKHAGIDYPMPVNQPIRAVKDGTIISASIERGYGNIIKIDHGNGLETRYAHLKEFLKRSGKVKQGEIIAKSGGAVGDPGAGRTTGPHLHFEVRVNGEDVNPVQYLQAAVQEQRTPTRTLPAGYILKSAMPRQRNFQPIIITPNGSSFSASASSPQDIGNFDSLSPQTQAEILFYFGLK